MTNQKLICGSCKAITVNIEGSTLFKCPNCGKTDIIRCKHCRAIAAKYKCPECNFEGPN